MLTFRPSGLHQSIRAHVSWHGHNINWWNWELFTLSSSFVHCDTSFWSLWIFRHFNMSLIHCEGASFLKNYRPLYRAFMKLHKIITSHLLVYFVNIWVYNWSWMILVWKMTQQFIFHTNMYKPILATFCYRASIYSGNNFHISMQWY